MRVEWNNRGGEWMIDDVWDPVNNCLDWEEGRWEGLRTNIRDYCQTEANRTGRPHRIIGKHGVIVEVFKDEEPTMSAADKEWYIVEFVPKIGDLSYPEWVEDERWQCENPYADFKDACDYAESEYKRTGILHRVVHYEQTVLRTFDNEEEAK